MKVWSATNCQTTNPQLRPWSGGQKMLSNFAKDPSAQRKVERKMPERRAAVKDYTNNGKCMSQ